MISVLELERIAQAIAYAAFYMIVLALTLTWIIQIFLHPRSRMEWAEFCKITAFTAIVWRTVWTITTGKMLPVEVATVFWAVCFFLVGFYFITLVEDWAVPVFTGFRQYCTGRCLWPFLAALLALGAVAMYLYLFVVS
jgi:hypothetical protein